MPLVIFGRCTFLPNTLFTLLSPVLKLFTIYLGLGTLVPKLPTMLPGGL